MEPPTTGLTPEPTPEPMPQPIFAPVHESGTVSPAFSESDWDAGHQYDGTEMASSEEPDAYSRVLT